MMRYVHVGKRKMSQQHNRKASQINQQEPIIFVLSPGREKSKRAERHNGKQDKRLCHIRK